MELDRTKSGGASFCPDKHKTKTDAGWFKTWIGLGLMTSRGKALELDSSTTNILDNS